MTNPQYFNAGVAAAMNEAHKTAYGHQTNLEHITLINAIEAMERAMVQYDPMVLPTKETAITFLLGIVNTELPEPLKEMCLNVISDDDFAVSPGSSKYHHDYEGGLAQHVAEVMYYALTLANPVTINMHVLITAVVFHDYLKTQEYRFDDAGKVQGTPYRDCIGHVVGGALAFIKEASKVDSIGQEFMGAVTHCLLAHHGRVEWRSPVEPHTMEAWLLHAADMLSARP